MCERFNAFHENFSEHSCENIHSQNGIFLVIQIPNVFTKIWLVQAEKGLFQSASHTSRCTKGSSIKDVRFAERREGRIWGGGGVML